MILPAQLYLRNSDFSVNLPLRLTSVPGMHASIDTSASTDWASISPFLTLSNQLLILTSLSPYNTHVPFFLRITTLKHKLREKTRNSSSHPCLATVIYGKWWATAPNRAFCLTWASARLNVSVALSNLKVVIFRDLPPTLWKYSLWLAIRALADSSVFVLWLVNMNWTIFTYWNRALAKLWQVEAPHPGQVAYI